MYNTLGEMSLGPNNKEIAGHADQQKLSGIKQQIK